MLPVDTEEESVVPADEKIFALMVPVPVIFCEPIAKVPLIVSPDFKTRDEIGTPPSASILPVWFH